MTYKEVNSASDHLFLLVERLEPRVDFDNSNGGNHLKRDEIGLDGTALSDHLDAPFCADLCGEHLIFNLNRQQKRDVFIAVTIAK